MFFDDYQLGSAFDEMFSSEKGLPREHYASVHEFLNGLSAAQIQERKAKIQQAFLELGVTFTVYSSKEGTERIFPFDPLPRLIPYEEWQRVEQGLIQRVTALNLFLHDLYHDRSIVYEGVIPEELITSSVNFRPELLDFDIPGNVYIHVCGTDLIRGENGEYLVLEDNLRCPSGVSYVLENREVMKRAFPNFYGRTGVMPVSQYPAQLLETLRHAAPQQGGDPTCVVLTPGSFNSAYFEHSLLAREMGIEIVEGRDLIVQNERVYARTTRGLSDVHVIYRRIDDDFIDPTVFRKDSLLGVPGLVGAYRKGNVTLANALGTGVADDKVIYAYVPEMIRFYLSQEPILQQIPTYLGFREDDLAFMLENLPNLVVKPANESGGYGLVVGSQASTAQLEECKQRILADPRNFIAQRIVNFSQHPTLCEGNQVEGRHVDLRPFVLYGERPVVMPGGLTRVALKKGSLVVNSSQGGGSKDTWVLKPKGA